MNTGFELCDFSGDGKMFAWAALTGAEVTIASRNGKSLEELSQQAVDIASRACSRLCITSTCGLTATVIANSMTNGQSVEISCEEPECSANQSIPYVSRAQAILVEGLASRGIVERVIDDLSSSMADTVKANYIQQN